MESLLLSWPDFIVFPYRCNLLTNCLPCSLWWKLILAFRWNVYLNCWFNFFNSSASGKVSIRLGKYQINVIFKSFYSAVCCSLPCIYTAAESPQYSLEWMPKICHSGVSSRLDLEGQTPFVFWLQSLVLDTQDGGKFKTIYPAKLNFVYWKLKILEHSTGLVTFVVREMLNISGLGWTESFMLQ